MTTEANKTSTRKIWLPYVLLITGIVLTILVSFFILQNLQAEARQKFQTAVVETEAEIETRIEAYVALLRGGGGLYAASILVEPREFRTFVKRLEIKEFYSGVQGMGFAPRVTPENRARLLKEIHAANPDLRIHPEPGTNESFPIFLLEPHDKRNAAAIGYDMFSEPTRRAAMIRARDTGLPAATGKVKLVQEIDPIKQPGFLIYLPVYTGGIVPETVEERRKNLMGFIYAPFRAGDFLQLVIKAKKQLNLHFEVYDGTDISQEGLLYKSGEHTSPESSVFERLSAIRVAGHIWTIRFHSTATPKGIERLFPIIPSVGILFTFILFYLTYAEARARHSSEDAFANLQKSQAALKSSEELHRTVTQTASDGIIVTNADGIIHSINSAAEIIFGFSSKELIGQPLMTIVPNRFLEKHMRGFQRFVQTGKRTIGWSALQMPGLRKDGTEIPLEISYGSFKRDGKLFFTGILRDISERKQAEAALLASQQQMQTIADALPVLIGSVSPDLCYRFTNRTYQRWFNLMSDNLSGQHMKDVLGDAVFEKIEIYLNEGLSGKEVSFEEQLPYKHGHSRQIHGIVIPEKNAQGEVAGLFLLMMDISERKRQEDAARFLAAAGKKFAESLSYEDTLRTVAEQAVPTLGDWCAVDMLTQAGLKRLQSIHHDPEKNRLVQELSHRYPPQPNSPLTSQIVQKGEVFFLPKVTDDFLIEISYDEEHLQILRNMGLHSVISVPIRGRDRIYGAISFATVESRRTYTPTDIHVAEELASRAGLAIENALLYQAAQQEIEERRVIERALRESEERFRIIVEQAHDYAIFTLDPEGRVSLWNSGAERILGYTEPEIIGQSAEIIFTPEDQKNGAADQELETAKQTGRALDERWHMRKDGSRFFCSGYMFALRDEQGGLRGFTKIMRDITERKRWEEDIQRLNQELETRVKQRTAALQESYEQMETFTYTVAHDLRAPLRSMLGFSQAILEESETSLDETSRDFLRRITRAAHRMDSLIQDLLAYSHISRTNLKFEPVSLQSVIDEVLNTVSEHMQAKHVKVRLHGPFPSLLAHRATLQTIVLNLVSNAIKFSSPQPYPQVELRAENITHETQRFVRFWVIDNGIGIEAEHHERIFRVFERLHGPESYSGTGIGLAIVKKGVERMNGRVGVESRPNEGSKFWIELPAL